MASADKGTGISETIAEEAKGLVGEAYKDAAKPVVTRLGTTLGLAVEVALSPVNLVLGGLKLAMGRLSAAVERKLAAVPAVPADRLLPVPTTIAAPAALQYALLGDGPEVAELREMFENLLVASMDRNTAASAHPAFVSMIAQLTSDEARILRSINRDDYALVKTYDDPEVDSQSDFGDDINPAGVTGPTRDFQTRLGADPEIDRTRIQQYISNLERLGILRISERTASNVDEYDALYAAIAAEVSRCGTRRYNGSIRVTALGRQFLDACVRSRAR